MDCLIRRCYGIVLEAKGSVRLLHKRFMHVPPKVSCPSTVLLWHHHDSEIKTTRLGTVQKVKLKMVSFGALSILLTLDFNYIEWLDTNTRVVVPSTCSKIVLHVMFALFLSSSLHHRIVWCPQLEMAVFFFGL